MFLSSPPTLSTKSALFVAWGQLLTYDLSLTVDNSSEPFDVPCNYGERGLLRTSLVRGGVLCCPLTGQLMSCLGVAGVGVGRRT